MVYLLVETSSVFSSCDWRTKEKPRLRRPPFYLALLPSATVLWVDRRKPSGQVRHPQLKDVLPRDINDHVAVVAKSVIGPVTLCKKPESLVMDGFPVEIILEHSGVPNGRAIV